MKRWTSAQLLRAAEFVYAAIALFALTQGPIYRAWSASAAVADRLPNPSIPHVYFASFVAIQLPALVMVSRRCNLAWVLAKSNLFLIALTAWLVLSIGWSTFARYSLPEAVALTLTTCFGLYLVVSFTIRRVLWVFAVAMALGVGFSWFAVMRLWEGAVNFQEDHWAGIYFDRNSLAPVASLAVVVAIYLAFTEGFRKALGWSKRIIAGLVMLALGVVAGIELWQSKSRTSPLALVMAVVGLVLWLTARFLTRKIPFARRLEPHSASGVSVFLAISFYLLFTGIGDVPGVAERVPSLIPRQALWSLSWAGILEKPLFGWGWMAAWHTTEFFNSDASNWASAWDSEWAHNGYHDVLLGGGVVAAVLLLGFLLSGMHVLASRTTHASTLRFFLAVFTLTAATRESFFVGSHFMWAILVFSLGAPVDEPSSLQQKETNNSSLRSP